MQGERNVSQVVEETGRNQANVSKHLKMLAEAGLVGRRKEGLQVFYRIDDPLVERLCELVCATIVQEAQQGVERQTKLLDGWGGQKSAVAVAAGQEPLVCCDRRFRSVPYASKGPVGHRSQNPPVNKTRRTQSLSSFGKEPSSPKVLTRAVVPTPGYPPIGRETRNPAESGNRARGRH